MKRAIKAPIDLDEVAEELAEFLGTETFLDSLLRAMTSSQKEEYFEYILRTHDIWEYSPILNEFMESGGYEA